MMKSKMNIDGCERPQSPFLKVEMHLH